MAPFDVMYQVFESAMPYEAPHAPELVIDTGTQRLAASVDDVMALLHPWLLVVPLQARL
jgi:adenylylsulfate kinase-like enzyme